jgi:hypothetical protein
MISEDENLMFGVVFSENALFMRPARYVQLWHLESTEPKGFCRAAAKIPEGESVSCIIGAKSVYAIRLC